MCSLTAAPARAAETRDGRHEQAAKSTGRGRVRAADSRSFLLDGHLDVQAKAERGELFVLPPSIRVESAEPTHAGPGSSHGAPVLASPAEYSDDDATPDVTVDIAIEDDAGPDETGMPSSSSSAASLPKRPRMSTPHGDELFAADPASDARPGSPKRPRLT